MVLELEFCDVIRFVCGTEPRGRPVLARCWARRRSTLAPAWARRLPRRLGRAARACSGRSTACDGLRPPLAAGHAPGPRLATTPRRSSRAQAANWGWPASPATPESRGALSRMRRTLPAAAPVQRSQPPHPGRQCPTARSYTRRRRKSPPPASPATRHPYVHKQSAMDSPPHERAPSRAVLRQYPHRPPGHPAAPTRAPTARARRLDRAAGAPPHRRRARGAPPSVDPRRDRARTARRSRRPRRIVLTVSLVLLRSLEIRIRIFIIQ